MVLDNFEEIIEIPLNISSKNGKPMIILRKEIMTPEIIRKLTYAAIHHQSIIMVPKFYDTFKCVSNMIQQKIIKRNEISGELEYII